MQHTVHQFLGWLRKEWFLGAILAVNGYNGRRATRRGRLSLRERVAVDWPSVDGIARCRTLPTSGIGHGVMHMRAVPTDGSELVFWEHTFSSWEEARFYAAALDGRSVPIHQNPAKPEERIVCWADVRRIAPVFVRPDGGRMSAAAFRWVRGFQASVLALAALLATDAALFATPWGRNFEWHGLCLCDLSISLLVGSMVLLPPALALRRRTESVTADVDPDRGRLRQVSRWVYIGSVGGWAGLLLSAAYSHGNTPDAVFWGLLTLPAFPMLWSSAMVAVDAQRKLRPSAAPPLHKPAPLTHPQPAERAALVEARGLP